MILTKEKIEKSINEGEYLFIKKGKVEEVIDADGNIMGDNDTPEITPDSETMASKTTDYNSRVHGQDYKNDFLGRFGFYFYESENIEKPQIYEDLAAVVGDDKVNGVMEAIKPHLEKVIDEMNTTQVNEAKVVEDQITPKKEDKSIKAEKAVPSLSKEKLKKLEDIFGKLKKDDVNKLIDLLEKLK